MKFIPWRRDEWFSKQGSILPWDKVEHFLLGIIGYLLLFYLIGFDGMQCFTILISAAIVWEIRDGFITGFSWKDLIAGLSGMTCGFVIASIM